MKIPSKYILNLIVANLFWSFIPIVVTGLFAEISILTIIFLRFFISGIFLFFTALMIVIINNAINQEKKISIKELIYNLRHKNRRFYNIRTYNYYFLIGFFGIILHILFYFLALKKTSIPFAMIGMLMTIIFISLYEKGVNYEKFDIFRILFIVMLSFSIIIITFVSLQGAELKGTPIELFGFIYLILYSITGSFLYISIDRDSSSKKELYNININKYYKIPRALIKMSISFISGVIILVPFSFLIAILPIETDITEEAIAFFKDFTVLFDILSRWEIIYLIIFATIIPYLLIFLAKVNWRSKNLTYSQWSSILGLIDPISVLIFSVLLINEFFPHDYLIIVIVFLIITIVLRYAHEVKNIVHVKILVKIKKGCSNKIPLKILKFYGVREIDSLIGEFDLMLHVKVNSFKDFHYLINRKLKLMNEILVLKVQFVDKIEDLSNN
ncbi:MAG: DMT family transporter [Candidatus Lokiarchaeota archaeon]|nr:DMT family transporter [Candidatus Lokiarchaeota archaeon]